MEAEYIATFAALLEILCFDSAPPLANVILWVDKVGGPEVSIFRDIPVPTPKAHEVLMKVQWTGVNYCDIYQRTGVYDREKPYTAGFDVVGTLLTSPSGSPGFTVPVGSTVFCPSGSAWAEYIAVPASHVALLSKGIDKPDDVSLNVVGLTALALVRECYAVKKGDWVLVRSAAGGVGLVLMQIVKYLGGHVIGTVSTPEKAKVVKKYEYGADLVLLPTNPAEENVKKILEASGSGVHVSYDGVGASTWDENFEVVRKKGTIVFYGNASGTPPDLVVNRLMLKVLRLVRSTLPSMIATPEEFFKQYANELVDITKKGPLKFEVHKEYPFTAEGIIQAEKDIVRRGTTGKLLIHVSD
ncbi:NADPH2:quinone reductase [Cryptococcus wingfieldii CBS 7118]|uniref:NADPH2:quinone reductase n=1 Tax=Cryptococcus wingfieldii CBS 7118 TaxID=1295528 RepID=A0A1E3IL20_9TREE|nr:NADPH2:quinone reductase [Cryptococcus wingfieldii CBS 7118]ODN89135.1 NADPH2:quinone reductase [Cryptococcus wingfieldii CBS 7118]